MSTVCIETGHKLVLALALSDKNPAEFFGIDYMRKQAIHTI